MSACTPDVMRLCSDAIPDEGRITKCMIQNEEANQRGVHDGHEERPGACVARCRQVNTPNIGSNGFHPCWCSSERPPEAPGAFLFAAFCDSCLHFFCYWAGIGAPVDTDALARR